MAEEKNYMKMVFAAKDENVAAARLAAASCGAAAGFSLSEVEEIKVAVSEAVSNAMIHGYCGDETRLVEMTLTLDDAQLSLEIKDDGVGIEDVEKAMTPMYSSLGDHLGLGFVFMDSFMDSLTVISSPQRGTAVRMTRERPKE